MDIIIPSIVLALGAIAMVLAPHDGARHAHVRYHRWGR